MDTYLTGTFLSVKHEAKLMIEGGSGAIVNVSSICATLPMLGGGAYCRGKAGVEMLTKVSADLHNKLGRPATYVARLVAPPKRQADEGYVALELVLGEAGELISGLSAPEEDVPGASITAKL